jgi:hypothetical protein
MIWLMPWLIAFRRYSSMIHSVRPMYFYGLGSKLHAVLYVRPGIPPDVRAEILGDAYEALKGFTADENNAAILPRSVEKGMLLVFQLEFWVRSSGACRDSDLPSLHGNVDTYETILMEELERRRNLTLTNPGNLSVDVLLDEASATYPKYVLDLVDVFIRNEIDEAGRCLACDRNTACGFHILRSVEVAIKGYIVAVKGSLPKNRNWGEYIDALKKHGASQKLINEVIVLKARRNPLMHPQDKLDENQARQLFCQCEGALCAVIDDVCSRRLDSEFVASLALLPTL